MASNAKEIEFELAGMTVAAKQWGNPNGMPTLALHGWLDNAASFDYLAPLLSELNIIAIDLPGHGLSDHHSPDCTIHFIDYVIDMMKLIEVLQWEKFALLGHSLGGAIACILAGTVPNRILKMAVIDGLGPMTTPAENTPGQLRLYLQDTLKQTSRVPKYSDPMDAVQSRLQVNIMLEESAKAIVLRGLMQNSDGLYQWRTDPRLLKPSALQLTEPQTLAFLREITAPMLLIRPEPGFPFAKELIQRRIEAIHQLKIIRVPGEHHVHLDDPNTTASHLRPFFLL